MREEVAADRVRRADAVNVRGVDLAYADDGSGPAFFWGHGFASSRAQDAQSGMLDWDLLARTHRVVRWDARGHGESPGTTETDDYRWDNLAHDLLALAGAMGIEQFVAGGVSMGAATALHAATQAPDRVTGLVLALPPTAYETRAAADYNAGAELVEHEGVDAYVAHVNAEPVPAILQSFAAGFRFVPAVPAQFLPAALRGAGASDLPDPEAIRALATPALILAWDTDPGHPLSTAERLHELLPHSELHVAHRLRDIGTWTALVDTFLAR